MSFAPNSQLPYGAEYYNLGHNSCLFPGKLLPYLFWDQDPLCRLGGGGGEEKERGVGGGGGGGGGEGGQGGEERRKKKKSYFGREQLWLPPPAPASHSSIDFTSSFFLFSFFVLLNKWDQELGLRSIVQFHRKPERRLWDGKAVI